MKDATNENTAEKNDPKNDPKQTIPTKQTMQNKTKAQKAGKRKQDEEQPDGKTFLSGVRMIIHLKLVSTKHYVNVGHMNLHRKQTISK